MACQTKPRGPSPRVQSQSLGDGPPFNLKPPNGCILAPSVEAKLWGVKTGMTLSAGRTLCPWLIARAADPPKYRQVHSELATLLQDYSPHVISKSIDEFCLILPVGVRHASPAVISTQIKSRIKSEIGDYLRVSIGVSTNQILAKLVAKAARRLRASGSSASGVHLYLRFADSSSWNLGRQLKVSLSSDLDIFLAIFALQGIVPSKPVKKIAFTCYGLREDSGQLSCLRDLVKQKSLVNSLDKINSKWGEYSISYGSMLGSAGHVHDAIAFGK